MKTVAQSPKAENAVRPAWVFVLTWSAESTGGVNEVVFALAEQVRKLGWHPIIAVATWDRIPQPSECRGVEVVGIRLREPFEGRKGWRVGISFLKTAWSDAVALRQFLRKRNVRVLNLHFPGLSALLPALLRSWGLLPATLVVSLHGSEIAEARQSAPLVKSLWRYLLKHADVVTACSAALRQEAESIFHDVSIRTVYNGIDRRLFQTKVGPANPIPVILHVGKFEQKKAQDVVLRAVALLLARGVAVRLLLAGGSGPQLDETRTLIATLGLSGHVEMRVNVPHGEMPALMRDADLFVLPSRAEPFGLVLLEAGATGLPVIATKVGGIPELLTDGETAILIPAEDDDALADAIEQLIRDPKRAGQLASRWHQQVGTRWSWEETAAHYVDAVGQIK